MKATVGLGSNLGDRLANLQFAIDSLNATVGTQVHCISPVYETDPVGGPAQGDYLNAVAVLKTILSPEQLLDATQQIELAAHRERNERWGPRTLDLDLLAMDDLTLNGDVITIHKPFNQMIKLRMIKEATLDTILEGVTDTISMDEMAMSEIFWLTKVLGNYNINKIGENFVFDNNGHAMIMQRVTQ